MFDLTFAELLLNLAMTAFVYLLIPIVIAKLKQPKTSAQIKKIVIVNGVIWFLVFTAVQSAFGDGSASAGACVLWSGVAYYILEKRCLINNDKPNSPPLKPQQTQEVKYSLSPADEKPLTPRPGTYHISGSDIMLKKDDTLQFTPPAKEEFELSTTGETRASQKPKSNRVSIFCGLAIFLVLIAVIVTNVNRLNEYKTQINSLNTQIEELKHENAQLRSYSNNNRDKIDFIDECVVFIEDDGTDLYHKYECNRFIGDSFWAFNTEYAEYMGFFPCSKCFK